LNATLQLLATRPLRDVSMEAIAEKAGVSKATIYKWWPSKANVALAAFLGRMQQDVEPIDTGSARQDFLHQVKSLIRFYSGRTGHIFGQFMAECQADPEFASIFREQLLLPRRDAVRSIWRRGVDRGEIAPDIDSDIVLDLVYAPMAYRFLAGHAPLNDREAGRLIDAVFDGIDAGRPRAGTPRKATRQTSQRKERR
jgi:AcrR family transcriptional regulator